MSNLSQYGKSLSLTMYRRAISVNKERSDTCNLSQKGKSLSSNTNDPQIIITSLSSEKYKLGSSDYKEV